VPVVKAFEVITNCTSFTMKMVVEEMAVTGVCLALSVARKLMALPATTAGAVGVLVTSFPTICRPAGREPEFTVKMGPRIDH